MCAILGFTSPSLKKEQVLPYFEKTKSRGPDDTRLEPAGSGMLGFHRLAIMGLHPEGMQPFHRGGDMAVCNGELYGFRPVKKALEAKGYVFASDSDCEIILPLWQEYGTDMFAGLDAEFAMIIYDSASDSLVAARDPIGIRPLFYGYLEDGGIVFASPGRFGALHRLWLCGRHGVRPGYDCSPGGGGAPGDGACPAAERHRRRHRLRERSVRRRVLGARVFRSRAVSLSSMFCDDMWSCPRGRAIGFS